MGLIAEYRDSSPGLRRSFELYPDKIVVKGRRSGGDDFVMALPLQALVPEYSTFRIRSPHSRRAFIVFCVSLAFLWALSMPPPDRFSTLFLVAFAGLGATCLVASIYHLPRYKIYRFLNKDGVFVFDVIESKSDKERCLEFVETISEAIRRAKEVRDPLV
jgi:hypothetical protein